MQGTCWSLLVSVHDSEKFIWLPKSLALAKSNIHLLWQNGESGSKVNDFKSHR
jgi:hypothetical protein